VIINILLRPNLDGATVADVFRDAGISLRWCTTLTRTGANCVFYAEVRYSLAPVEPYLQRVADKLGLRVFYRQTEEAPTQGRCVNPSGSEFAVGGRYVVENIPSSLPHDAAVCSKTPQVLGRIHKRHTEPDDGATFAWLQEMRDRSRRAPETAGTAPITNAELRRLLRLVITGAE